MTKDWWNDFEDEPVHKPKKKKAESLLDLAHRTVESRHNNRHLAVYRFAQGFIALTKAINEAIDASDNGGGSASDAIQDMLFILEGALEEKANE